MDLGGGLEVGPRKVRTESVFCPYTEGEIDARKAVFDTLFVVLGKNGQIWSKNDQPEGKNDTFESNRNKFSSDF